MSSDDISFGGALSAQHMTPEERKLRAQVAAHASWAKTANRQARTARGTKASPADVEWHAKRLDPNRELPEAERYRRAENARKQYFANLSLKAATAARHRRENAEREAKIARAERAAMIRALLDELAETEGGASGA